MTGHNHLLDVGGYLVGVTELGPRDGVLVVSFGGNPSSSEHGPHPPSTILIEEGVRLLAVDRPGLGASQMRPDYQQIVDTAPFLERVLETMGLGNQPFGIIACSGGVPAALAVAARCPWARAAIVMAGLAPPDFEGYTEGMTKHNQQVHNAARSDPSAIAAGLAPLIADLRVNEYALLYKHIAGALSPSDKAALLANRNLGQQALSHKYGVQQDGGWAHNVAMLHRPWGFDPGEIEVPVSIRHGADDHFSSPAHSRKLHDLILGSEHAEDPGESHFFGLTLTAYEAIPRIRDAVIGDERAELVGRRHRAAILDFYGPPEDRNTISLTEARRVVGATPLGDLTRRMPEVLRLVRQVTSPYALKAGIVPAVLALTDEEVARELANA